MKKYILYKGVFTCVLLIFLSFQVGAQSVANYTFAGTNGTFTALSSPNATTWTGSTDDGVSALIPIGFDFWYMGVRYTNVSASTNGWIALGSTPTDFVYTNSLSTGGSPRPVIAPLWDDLDIASTANVTYKTSGTVGARVFTVQYLNVKWNYLALGAVCSFQVNFYESSGKVEYVYRSDSLAPRSASASIGLTSTATGSGNYLSVNNAGTSVSSTAESSVTTKRTSGRTYTFTPPVPAAPGSLSFSAIGNLTMTLNWMDLATNERGFVIYRSVDGTNYSFVSQVAAGVTSSLQSGLTTGTTYYWRIYALTEGALSTALSGTQATSCNGPVISQLPVGLLSYYKFGGNANDVTGNNAGTFQGGTPVQTTDRYEIANKAYAFNGTSNYISTAGAYANPTTFSVSIWFKTSTTTGGVLTGFSSIQVGGGGSRDRFIYMTGTGVLYFGLAPGSVKKYVSTAAAYNDGNWHMATATLGASGMKLYVDGSLTASDASVTAGENYTGYWRIGHQDIATWPNEPSSHYFQGSLDDAVVYQRELSASEIAVIYNSADGAGSNAPVCAGSSLNLTATTVSGATYSWTGPNGFTSALQNPVISYTAAYAGTYSLQVTIAGCAVPSEAYVRVLSTSTPGQWTGTISTDWATAGNWCAGVVPGSATDVVITSGATRMPNISTAVNSRSLTINNGATVTLAGTGTLNIAGTLTNNGTFTNSGTVNFNGTSGQQTFAGLNSFYNLTLNNSSGLLLPAAIAINNNLTLSAGTLNASNFNLTVAGNWINNVGSTAFTAGTGTVTFNSSNAQSIAGTSASTFNNLTITNAGNTVTLGANAIISGNLMVAQGTLDLAAFTANRATAGGILTVSNNAVLKIGGTNTYPANYNTNTLVVASIVEYSGTNQTVANQSYGNLKLSSSSGAAVKTFPGTDMTILGNMSSIQGTGTSVSFTAAAVITVNGNVSIGTATTFNGGSFNQNVGGNWVNAGVFNGNTGTVVFTGSGTNVSGLGTQNFNNLTVAASMVSFSAEGLSLTGNLATTGAGSFIQASGGTLLMTGTGKTISGLEISPDNLSITGTVTTTSSMILTGNLTVSGTFSASTGTITISGAAKTISGTGSKTFYLLSVMGTVSTAVNFSISSGLSVYGSLTASAGTATFTGSSTLSGTANLFNTTINGTSLQLSANSILGVAGLLTITAGTLNVSSAPNTVNFNGTSAQSINAITYSNLIFSTGGNKTAAGGLTVNNNITIGTGTTFIAGAFSHSIYNSWINNGSFTAGASTLQFLGTENATISGATTFNILTVNNSSATVAVALLSNVSVATLNMTLGTMLTGTNTLTITTTRTGNGIILGTITRNHAFNTLTAYAFEGPNNLITFTLPIVVNSVTVAVASAPVSDFPFGGSVSRVYNITVPSGTYVGATLRLHYEDSELNGNSESAMTLWHYGGSSWAFSGKSGNSTTSNYVEQSLLDITNRWTLSASSNVVQWNGSVSSDWNTAANWTVTQGGASRPPGPADVVNLGTVTFTNQPVINTAVSVKNINFGSAKAVTLSLVSGGSLSSADVKGAWSTSAIHTIDAGSQALVVNGNLVLSDGTAGHAINLNIGSGTATVGGSLTESGGANITFSGAGNLSVGGDFSYVSGVFTPGSGTVTYNGSANQILGIVNYNHLTINKSAANIIAGSPLTVNGNLSITAGEFDNEAVMTILGDVSIAATATLHNNGTLLVGGNWSNAGTYDFDNTGTNVIFNGAGTQTISASTFNNLEINKPVGSVAVLSGGVTLKGNLTGTSGTLDIKSFFFNRDIAGGTATIADAGTLIIGADNAPNKFANYNLGTNSTVIFNGLSTQHLLLPGVVYGNISFSNAGSKILYTPISVKGKLTIDNGATLDAGANTITLNGDWLNNGTFTPATSTVLFTGATKNVTGNTIFNKATVTGSYTILNDVTFNSLLNITSTGSLSGGSTINTTMNGDLINSGTLYTLGSTTFTGNVVQTVNLINAVTTVAVTVNFNGTVSPVLNSTSTPQFGFLNINNTGGVYPSVGWTVQNALTVGAGALFNGGTSTHNLLGSVTNNGTIASDGTLNFIPSAAATLNLGTNFSSTGTVVFGGAGAVTMLGAPGNLHDVLISNTNVAGISPSSNWTLSNNLTISNGSALNAGAGTYLIAGNIINNGLINGGSSTFTLNGSSLQNIYSPSAFYKLTLNNSGGTVSISSNVTVNDALTFILGKIQTGSFILIQPASGLVNGAAQLTGWVNGNFRKNIATGTVTKVFEIGNAANYLPVSLTFTGLSTSGDLTVATNAGDHPGISNSMLNAAKSVNRYWMMNNSGIAFTTVNVTFNYLAADVDAGASTSAFALGGYSNGVWVYPTVGSVTATSLTATGLRTFGDFQIGEMTIFIKTWDGGAGTANWGDAANWNTDGVPAATDNVELTGPYLININVAAVTKNLLLSDPGLVLTTNAGNSLSVSGNMRLAAGTFNTAASFPSVTGIVNVSAGTIGFTGTGAQTIPAYNYYNLTSSGNGARVLAGAGTIGIANTFISGTNAYTVAGSTIDYNGPAAQTVAASVYHHLTLSNGGLKSFPSGMVGIAGNLSVTAPAAADAVSNGGTISYNGTAAQTITAINYYNLEGANAAGLTLLDANLSNNLTVSSGTVSIGNSGTVQKIKVNGNIGISTGATLAVSTSSDATHLLTIGGDVVNNGSFNLRPDANSLCDVIFSKDGNQTVSGTGAVTAFNNMTTNLGSVNTNYVEVRASGFSAPNGFLTLNNGSFNLNNSALNITPFLTDITDGNYLIPANAGLWVNAGTINSVDMNWTIAGLIKVTGGIMNIGNQANNRAIPLDQAHFMVTAGNLNLASSIGNPAATWQYEMQGGLTTVNTAGSTVADIAAFHLDASAAVFSMSGGTLLIQNSGGSTGQNLGYNNLSAAGTGFTAGTLQMGNASTATTAIMNITALNPVYNLTLGSSNVTVPLQSSDLIIRNNVTISAGNLDINAQTLKIGGSISNNGSFIVSDGTIEMNGSTPQNIPAAAFTGNLIKNLRISNAAGVNLGGALNLTGILLVNSGQFSSGGNLTLISSPTQTALIDGTGLGSVSGNVTMQRYLIAGFGYKYFSPPFQNATVNSFSSTVDLNAAFPNFFNYIEDKLSSGFTSYTNPANPLYPLQGYAADFGASMAPKTVSMTGVVNNGALSATFYNHNRPYTRGFNLIGNPYPSPINWDAASGLIRTNIDNAVYFFNSGIVSQYTGAYSTYINGVSSDGIAGPVIASMQGFFVHVTDGTYPVNGSLAMNNSARVNDLSPVFHKSMAVRMDANLSRPRILLRLSAGFSDHSNSADPLVLYSNPGAGRAFDKELDAIKLMNANELLPNLYSIGADASKLVVKALQGVDTTTVIPLGIETQRDGNVIFNLRNLENWPAGLMLYLTDAVTGTNQDLQRNPVYTVNLKKGTVENRFSLRCVASQDIAGANGDIFTIFGANGALFLRIKLLTEQPGFLMISNVLGQVISRKKIEGNGVYQLDELIPNLVYLVSFITSKGTHTTKLQITGK